MSDAIFSVRSAFFFTWPEGSTIRLNGKSWKKIGLFRLLGPLDEWDRCTYGARVRWVNPFIRLKYLKRYPVESGIKLSPAALACVLAEPDAWLGCSCWHTESDQQLWDSARSDYLDRLLSECQFEEYVESRPIRGFLKRCWVEAVNTELVRSFRRSVAAWYTRNRPAPLELGPKHTSGKGPRICISKPKSGQPPE